MPVYIVGFPFGDALSTNKGNPTITIGKGSVSSIRKDASGKLVKIQIDGALNPGNSGGPVVDAKGNLVGIAVQKVQGNNIGIAIPPAELSAALDGTVGVPTIALTKTGKVPMPTYEVIVPMLDPMKKIKSVSLHFVDGAVPFDASKKGEPQLQSVGTSRKIDLAMKDSTANGFLPLSVEADSPGRQVTVQIEYVAAEGKTIYLDPLVVKIAAPAVMTGNITSTSTRTVNGVTTTTKFVSNIQLIYMKVRDDGTLDPEDKKLSPWLGGKPKDEVTEINGEGKRAIGIQGRGAAVLDAVGLLLEE